MNSRPRLLLAGVGSLVGVALHDVLANRREGVTLVGANADPNAWGMHQCDEQVELPLTDDPCYRTELERAVVDLDIDVVIPCRDPDAIVIAEANDDPNSPVVALTAPAPLVAMTQDKAATSRWCRANNVPFAATAVMSDPDAEQQLRDLVERWGFPLIAKPRDGSGSLGIRVLTEPGHVEATLRDARMVVQPFLEPPESLALDTSAGIPFFYEVPVPSCLASMQPIGRRGDLGPLSLTSVSMRLGRNESVVRVDNEEFAATARATTEVFRSAGWIGPLNGGWRWTGDEWVVIEFNPRFTGGTAGRTLLGTDEVAWVLNDWFGREVIPSFEAPTGDRVVRYLHDRLDPHPL